MNTPYHLKTVFTDQRPFAGVKEDVAWIFRNSLESTADSADLMLTFFVKHGKHWQRFDEIHRERAYANHVIKVGLRDAGFVVKAVYRCLSFEKPTRKTMRVCFAAKRVG
jgi:hypothetical protein